MSWPLYLAFVGAVVILVLIPGPNVALIIANSVAHGVRYGLLTILGSSAAMAIQLSVATLGMGSLLAALSQGFGALRWAGVAYLLWLGYRSWREPPTDLTAIPAQPRSARVIVLRGFFVSLTNPKTLFFLSAFLPQFVDPARDPTPQLWTLSVTFLVLAMTLDSGWAALAARFRNVLTANGRLRNRIAGGFFAGAGIGLALARQ